MDNNNKWTEFCNDINQSVVDVQNDFKDPKLTFVDSASGVELKHTSDKDALESIKKDILSLVVCDGDKKQELDSKIEALLDCIRERDDKVKMLKAENDKNKERLEKWYDKTKNDCDGLCDKLGNYTNENLGILSLFADIMEVVIDKDGYYIEKSKMAINGLIRSRKRSGFWRFVASAMLLLVALAVMSVLFVIIGTKKGLCGIEPTVWGKCIAVGFIVALSVGVVFLIIRICSLIIKSKNEVHLLQSLLVKMNNKMTKYEIAQELERIREIVEK